MTFSEQLNEYIRLIGCSGKELADKCGLSPAVISRYRSGARLPAPESDYLASLSGGIEALALAAGIENLSASAVQAQLTELLGPVSLDYELLAENLNRLLEALSLNISRLARATNYDASYISRVRTGQRRPANPDAFTDSICRFISSGCTAPAELSAVAALTGVSVSDLEDRSNYYSILRRWFCSEKQDRPDSVQHFLDRLDAFDLNNYIRSIHFDELKVPSLPFQLPTARTYMGLEQMQTGELDFFKATVLSHSGESLFMCSDMDMADMAQNVDFGKKWMFAIAMCLKKGLHLNMIHSIHRPFDEMMLGLESWMPIYMTGQIAPYYLKDAPGSVYQHLNYVSGAAALTGECIAGHHKQGKYYLTKKPEEIAYYRQKSEFMLKKALPLMDIYRVERRTAFEKFMDEDALAAGNRHGILSAPPIYTLSDGLLAEILGHSGLSETEKSIVSDYVKKARERMEAILRENPVLDELPRLSPEEFQSYPVTLSLEGLFWDGKINYSYEEYCRHLGETTAYAESHPNYRVSLKAPRAFRNMQIYIREGEYAIISKSHGPVLHFVIHQPQLRKAIENLVLPVTENRDE